ncbi:hypothetical protein AWENTII_013000 [Aspergillus wentii]
MKPSFTAVVRTDPFFENTVLWKAVLLSPLSICMHCPLRVSHIRQSLAVETNITPYFENAMLGYGASVTFKVVSENERFPSSSSCPSKVLRCFLFGRSQRLIVGFLHDANMRPSAEICDYYRGI